LPQRPYPWQKEPAFVSIPLHPIFARLLPDATVLRLKACEIGDTIAQITLRVQATQTRAPCPLCATPARRIPSDYGHTLADLPWAQYRVSLQLRVRTWFCHNRACPRRIFTERLPTVAAPWARRTLRLAQRLVALGVALGGKAGVHPCRNARPHQAIGVLTNANDSKATAVTSSPPVSRKRCRRYPSARRPRGGR
jgi:hypothetical protein